MTDEQRLDYIKSQIDSKQFISWKDAQFLLDMTEGCPYLTRDHFTNLDPHPGPWGLDDFIRRANEIYGQRPNGTRIIDDPDGLSSSGPLPDKPWTEWAE